MTCLANTFREPRVPSQAGWGEKQQHAVLPAIAPIVAELQCANIASFGLANLLAELREVWLSGQAALIEEGHWQGHVGAQRDNSLIARTNAEQPEASQITADITQTCQSPASHVAWSQ